MKRIVVTILAIAFLAGCSQATDRNSVNSEIPAAMESIAGDTETSAQNTEKTDNNSSQEEGSESTETIINKQESEIQKPVKENNSLVTSSETVHRPETENIINSNNNKDNSSANESVVEIPEPESSNATAEDAMAIAQRLVEIINEYRAEEGACKATVLQGLTKYAEYRSKQLVSNFAHNTNDERAAATALKYGQYINPVLYGMTGDPYYSANAREAIGKGSLFGTVDQIAERIATGFRNSKEHWSYVGGDEYKYIAVGITCENGYWYCDIAMSRTNTDN